MPPQRPKSGPDKNRTRPAFNVPDARGGRTGPKTSDKEKGGDTAEASPDLMRLQKFLAMAGVDSRRNCEEYIRTGRVTVDGEVVTDPARGVDHTKQDIRLDAEKLRPPKFRYYLVNKPRGFLCTNSDPQGRPRAIDLVPAGDQRLFTVGRLDENTEGMLLVTNDGDLAQRLAHPRFEVIRRYRCLVAGFPQPDILHQLREGMYFADGYFKFRSVRVFKRRGQSTILELELQEGKNREIRRLMARVGHKVLALERVAFGPLKLGSLPPGRSRELSSFEVRQLRQFMQHGESSGSGKGGQEKNPKFGYRTGQTRGDRKRPMPKAAGTSSSDSASSDTDQSRATSRPAPVRRPSTTGRPAATGRDAATRPDRSKSARPTTAGKPARKPAKRKPSHGTATKKTIQPISKGRDRRRNK
ncbi:MAG TPA: pseudouridine synthase [Planctomycetaceae bacterium]|nr:pseudouridine synthase [Planctomycetaceae bacterium]